MSFENKIMSRLRGYIIAKKYDISGSHRNLKIGKNVKITARNGNMEFGDNVNIPHDVVFAPLVKHKDKYFPSKIIVGNNVNFGVQNRVASAHEVIIEDNVLFAAFVHITDHSHEFENINVPISQQGIISNGPVRIGTGTWLGFGSHVLSGVTIGKNCVIAANSVVTNDVPDYCVVAGVPAKIIKRYSLNENRWVRVDAKQENEIRNLAIF